MRLKDDPLSANLYAYLDVLAKTHEMIGSTVLDVAPIKLTMQGLESMDDITQAFGYPLLESDPVNFICYNIKFPVTHKDIVNAMLPVNACWLWFEMFIHTGDREYLYSPISTVMYIAWEGSPISEWAEFMREAVQRRYHERKWIKTSNDGKHLTIDVEWEE